MIVTLDGPAGAGKSSVARALARRLAFHFLDTGAMYRAVVLAALRRNVPWHDADAVARLAREVEIHIDGDRTYLDGEDVSAAIRRPQVTAAVHFVADNPRVRAHLVELQRREAAGRSIVTEGRDQGTVVFPSAECKIFLTATPSERARRRLLEMRDRGETADLEEVLQQIGDRDARDESRPVGRLLKAPDAVEVVTDGMCLERVVDTLEQLVRGKQGRP